MINKINITFTVPQVTAINGDYTDLNHNAPFLQTLTKPERDSTQDIGNERYPYVQRTMDQHIVNHPNLVSGFNGNAIEANNDWTLIKQLDPMIELAKEWLQGLVDTRRIAADELYRFFRGVYDMAQQADAAGVAGAKEVVDDLAPLFAAQGPQPAPGPTV